MAVDYERIHASFKRDAGQMFENNTDYYSDNDNMFNKKKSNDTSVEYYRDKLGKFKNIFKKINVYYNLKNKDYGIPKEDIILKRYTI